MKKRLALVTLSLILAFNMVGCGKPAEPTGADAPQKDNLVAAMSGDARSIDPHAAGDSNSVIALNNVIETLFIYDDNQELVPHLAESYEQLDDLSYKFTLKKGVKFHNGEEMKASDVVFSFKRALSPVGARVQYIMNAVDGDGFEIIDDYTLIVRTKFPFSPFISYLPYIGAGIISEKHYTENPDTAPTNPVGTGPFKFVEWKKGSALTYVRSDEYWGEAPKFKDLEIRVIPENNSRMIELETGGVDIAFSVSPNDFERINASEDMELLTCPSTQFTQIWFNTTKAPLDNVKVRQAIDYAVDEAAIIKTVYRAGSAQYTPGAITPGQLYFDSSDASPRYDLEKAKQLMTESGVATPLKLVYITSENQVRVDIGTIMQTQLKEIGIELEIRVLESATSQTAVDNGEHDLHISGWGAIGFKDPDNNIYGPIHSSGIPDNNRAFYSNPELDALLDKERALPNGPEREAAVLAAQKIIREEVPYFTIDNPLQAVGVRSNVKGFVTTPAASHPLYRVYFE